MNPTAQQALDAYGGQVLWTNAKTIQAQVSVQGLLFTMKRRPFFNRAHISMDIARPYSCLTPIGRDPNISGVLDGHDVRLEDAKGNVLETRKDARRYFPYGKRLLAWDDLDMAYFANYAFWNYFTFPALLMRQDIAWQELKPGLLQATFPPEIPTHNPVQRFHFDPQTHLLVRHDYTANVVSGLATAAHVVYNHVRKGNAVYAVDRIVTPKAPNGKPLGKPVLIAIMVHDYQLKEK